MALYDLSSEGIIPWAAKQIQKVTEPKEVMLAPPILSSPMFLAVQLFHLLEPAQYPLNPGFTQGILLANQPEKLDAFMYQVWKDLERDLMSAKIESKWQEHGPGRGKLPTSGSRLLECFSHLEHLDSKSPQAGNL